MWSDLQTWHHQSKSKGKQDDTCCTVAMITVLLLVPSKFKLKFPVFFLTKKHLLPKKLLRSLLSIWELQLLQAGSHVPLLRVANQDIDFRKRGTGAKQVVMVTKPQVLLFATLKILQNKQRLFFMPYGNCERPVEMIEYSCWLLCQLAERGVNL